MSAIFKFFASLRLTVVLLAFSMVMIFFGTLDQVHYGIWHTQKLYFESFLVVWDYPEQWLHYDKLFWIHLPMPGGYLLGGMLFVNLLAAHFSRFKFTLKKSGIFPPVVGYMVAVGEQTGELEQLLERIAHAYEEEIDIAITRMTGLIEPIMIVLMAVVVGGIVAAVIIPLLQMSTSGLG